MEIITAGDGTAHVSSADDGTIYAGIAGNECYVTGVGERLSCTMQGANTALVGTGVGIMYGRAFRVAMPEEVTIQSGTQSQRRHDVICAHFTTSSEGHESGELVVLKGTPTSGQEAEDPEIPSGDILDGATEAYMPLWRIPLDGINVGEPEAMFDVLMSMSELQGEIAEVRDSVSQNRRRLAGIWGVTSVHAASSFADTQGGGGYCHVMKTSDIEERIGRGYDQSRDRIISINGDPDACSSAVTGVKVVGTNVRCYVSPKPATSMRIDTLIVAG